ncbi:hemerythrin domain-containing protein [Streptomyces nigrescens]
MNCLTLCQGLHNHHTGEDAGMFPMLGRHHPELAPALERMHQEHQKLAVLLAALQKVISAEDADPQLVLSEVERLTEEVESHLTYEEEQLIPVLDGGTC